MTLFTWRVRARTAPGSHGGAYAGSTPIDIDREVDFVRWISFNARAARHQSRARSFEHADVGEAEPLQSSSPLCCTSEPHVHDVLDPNVVRDPPSGACVRPLVVQIPIPEIEWASIPITPMSLR